MSLPAPLPVPSLEPPVEPDALALPAGRRGFVLYVGLDEAAPGGSASELVEAAELLRELAADLVPSAETYTALSLVPAGVRGTDVRP